MKVVILAAGKGSRLGHGHLPKTLTPLVDDLTILGHQLQSLGRYISLSNVIVVVGYHKEEIMERYPDLLYVFNPSFAEENTSKSLLRALRKCDEDVLWINADVVFHDSVLDPVFALQKTGMVVNVGRVGEEEVKYRTDGKGRIVEVSKKVERAEGEAVGINFVTKADLGQLCEQLDVCEAQDYFEKALEGCIVEGMDVRSIPIEASLCTEVDFPEDLVRANSLIKKWSEAEKG
jgi:L-glutamine-phosphate cytidylyltransferase